MAPDKDKNIEFRIGTSASMSMLITEAHIQNFADLTGDTNPVHLEEDYAQKTRFKGRIAHGMLAAGLISAVLGTKLPGPGAIYLNQSLKFLYPTRAGDEITAVVTVTDWNADKKILSVETDCTNQDGIKVLTGSAVLLYEPV